MLEVASGTTGSVAIARPAIGRGGTNALYLRPPGVIGLHFGGEFAGTVPPRCGGEAHSFPAARIAGTSAGSRRTRDLERLRRAV